MNVAMKLLGSFGVKMEGAGNDGVNTGVGPASFNPSQVVTQQSGLFDRAAAQQQQKEQDEDLGADPTLSPAPSPTPSPTPAPAPAPDAPAKLELKGGEGNQAPEPEFVYDGIPIKVENKPEMVALFKEKGLDIDSVNKELFSKDGLTEDTRTKLDEAFGKMAVDMYLQGWKTHHDAFAKSYKLEQAQQDSQLKAQANEAAGGKWNEVLDWATKNLTDAEYNEYAAIINSGGKAMQLAVAELTSRSGIKAQKLEMPSVSPRALPITATSTGAIAEDYAITAKQYHEAITSREYYKNAAEWDKRRQAGMEKGI